MAAERPAVPKRIHIVPVPVLLRELPLPMGHMQQAVQWHRYRTQDPGLVWLRGLLRQAVQRMDAALVGAGRG